MMKPAVISMRYCLCLFVVFAYLSCSDNKISGDELTISGYDEPILSNGEQLEVESFEIIPLEETEHSLIDVVLRVEAVDSMFIVQTGSKLLGFNRNGDFVCEYGRRGRGPNEYLTISSFIVDRFNGTVRIIDESTLKTLVFDINGAFRSYEDMENEPLYVWTHMGVHLDAENVLFSNKIYNDINTIYTIVNNNGTKRDVFKLPVKTENVAVPAGRRTISSYQDTIKLIVPFDKKIYTIDGNYKLKSLMSISTKKPVIRAKKIKDIDDFGIFRYMGLMNEGYFVGFTDIFETREHILLNFYDLNYFFISKNSRSGRLYDYAISDNHSYLPFINIIGSTQEHLIGVGEPLRLIMMAKEQGTDNEDKNLDRLVHYSKTLSFNSNPCILLYKLKISADRVAF